MSQIPCKQSTRIEMTGRFKHYFPGNLRRNFCLRFVTIPVTKACKKPLYPTRSPVKKRGTIYLYQPVRPWKLSTQPVRPWKSGGKKFGSDKCKRKLRKQYLLIINRNWKFHHQRFCFLEKFTVSLLS